MHIQYKSALLDSRSTSWVIQYLQLAQVAASAERVELMWSTNLRPRAIADTATDAFVSGLTSRHPLCIALHAAAPSTYSRSLVIVSRTCTQGGLMGGERSRLYLEKDLAASVPLVEGVATVVLVPDILSRCVQRDHLAIIKQLIRVG